MWKGGTMSSIYDEIDLTIENNHFLVTLDDKAIVCNNGEEVADAFAIIPDLPENCDGTIDIRTARKIARRRAHRKQRAENDFPTPPEATLALLERESFVGDVWEPSCGRGDMSKVLLEHGLKIYSSDLIDRGFGDEVGDFFQMEKTFPNIITNPPYSPPPLAQRFVEHALECATKKVAMLLRLDFLESQERKEFLENSPLSTVYVFSWRISFYPGVENRGHSPTAYAWYIWDFDFHGEPRIRWI
jgi:hypothetical protein